jgi:hypothetical protein
MKDNAIPVFLERRSYRQRRLMDFARLLPLLGIVLWLVPLLWPQADLASDPVRDPATTGAMSMSAAILYIFGVWVVLVAGALFVAGLLNDTTDTEGGKDA